MSAPAAVILTSEKFRPLSDLLCRALSRWCPGWEILLLDAWDDSWASPVPPDVREIINGGDRTYHICLRRVFDAPLLTSADTIYLLDADCFVMGPMDDWGPCAFMASWAGPDDADRLAIWRELGVEIDEPYPCLCAGTCSFPRQMLIDGRDTAIHFVRQAVKMGYYRPKKRAALDNALVSGLWKMRYPMNPLPRERYAYINTTSEMALYHPGCWVMSQPDFPGFVAAYKAFLNGGSKEPLCRFRPRG